MKKLRYSVCSILCVLIFSTSNAQPTKTANDLVNPYMGNSFFGVNMGYYPGWTDKNLAEISAGKGPVQGIGATTLRPTLPEIFLDQWGYNIRLSEFQYYKSLGLKDLTVFIQTPSKAHQSTDKFCGTNQSLLFANMYLPIWDGGANGTPINDNNYYALYVYKTVTAYKENVKFWEIMNEPDYTTSSHGWENEAAAGSWWKNNPDPCDLTNMQAPVQHYIRLLRISYEVIKSIDPTAYVTTGGIGYPSFLDAILRNTDNPDNGKVTNEFPLKGGAYFDVLSFHVYPMYEPEMQKMHTSDGGALGMVGQKNRLETVLLKYGYNGATFPKKEWIITETNVGRKTFGNEYGSNHMQRNFVIKSSVMAMANNIKQLHFYTLGDSKTLDAATDSYSVMGMYQPLTGTTPFNQIPNDQAIACKTTSDHLSATIYDAKLTGQMNVPPDVYGAAFKKSNNAEVYVLWGKTTTDKSEIINTVYSFPAAMQGKKYLMYEWDFAKTNSVKTVTANSVSLSGNPIFLVEDLTTGVEQVENKSNSMNLSLSPNPTIDKRTKLMFHNPDVTIIGVQLFDLNGTKIKDIAFEKNLNLKVLNLNFDGVSSGTYMLQIIAEGWTKSSLINID